MKYRADIDGLRAIAVLPVLFFHTGVTVFSGGFVGVDVFFVISGYVIAMSLLGDLSRNQFSILGFYERRVRRIFPALFFMFALTWIAAWVLFLPSYFEDFSKSLLSSAGFVSNIYFWKYSGYFENSALLRPLLHTWSLSVEEQFYIFMPIAMYVVAVLFKRRWAVVFLPVILASFALSVYATSTAPTANLFLLPTRAWELLLGALLAMRPPPPANRPTAEFLAAAGLGLIVFAVVTYTKATPFPGLTALAPCLGAAMLIYAGTSQSTAIGRFLSIRPLVWIGLISYSLYLVHWPIVVFVRYVTLQEPSVLQIVGIVIASLALAAFSWRFIEQPFRHPAKPVPRLKLLSGGVAAMALAMMVGASGVWFHGAPWRFPDLPQQADSGGDLWKTGTCFLEGDPDFRQWDATACTRTNGSAQNALLWGDSFAAHYVPGILKNAGMISANVMQYTAAGCPPVLDYYSYARPHCQEFNRNALEIIKRHDVKTVILAARWVDLESRGLEMIESTIEALRRAGVEVWVVGQSAEFVTDVWAIGYRKGHGADGADAWPLAFDSGINTRLRGHVGGARFIDPLDYLCRQSGCTYRDRGKFLYADNAIFLRWEVRAPSRPTFPWFVEPRRWATRAKSRPSVKAPLFAGLDVHRPTKPVLIKIKRASVHS